MPFLLRNISLNLGEDDDLLPDRLMARFSLAPDELVGFCVLRKAIDARKKPHIKFIYTIEFTLADEEGFWRQHCQDQDIEIAPARRQPLFTKPGNYRRIHSPEMP